MICLKGKSLEDIAQIQTTIKEVKSGLLKDIRKEYKNDPTFTKSDEEALLYSQMEHYGFPMSIANIMPTYKLYRTNTASGSETSVNVHKIEEFKGGFKILYTTEKREDAKVVRVASNGKTMNAVYDMENLRETYREMQKSENQQHGQQMFTFRSHDGSEFEFNDENSIMIDAELINDTTKQLEIFDMLLEADSMKLSPEHQTFLREALMNITNMTSKVIPDMVQIINLNANKTEGTMTIKGRDKGELHVNVSQGAILAGNQMSAAEVYVHELKHASLEFAQKFNMQEVANAMSDIKEIYNQFLDVVTVDDFMPETYVDENTRRAEREHAKEIIDYLRRPDVGLNEFIVMSETNMMVKKVLEEKVVANKKEYKDGKLFQKLLNLIKKVYDAIYTIMRGNANNLDGAIAMAKYIKEISNANNIAMQPLKEKNLAIKYTNDLFDFLNINVSKILTKIGKEVFLLPDSKLGVDLDKQIRDFTANPDKYNVLQRVKLLWAILGRWIAGKNVHEVGTFETWLELTGLPFLKPEGSIQQLLRVFRQSDKFETMMELSGLLSNKVEYNTEKVLGITSKVIKEGFGGEIDPEDSIALTTGVLDIDLSSLINPELNGSEDEQVTEIFELLDNDTKLDDAINETIAQLKVMTKNKQEHNFIVNQAKGLGRYMVHNESGSGQLTNSFLIYGLANLDLSKTNIITRNELNQNTRAFIDRLSTLYGIKETDKNVRKRLVDLSKTEDGKNGMISLMKYDILAKNQFIGDINEKQNDMSEASIKKRIMNYKHAIDHIKGRHEKNHSNWINYEVGLKSDEEKFLKRNYHIVENSSFNDEYQLYVNSDFTQLSWIPEAMVMTNDGQKINSYLNILKKSFADDDMSPYDIDEVNRIKPMLDAKLDNASMSTLSELEKMQSDTYVPNNIGMRPVFNFGKGSDFFVTDMDVNLKKDKKENILRTDNTVNVVLGKTFSRAVNLQQGKEVNMKLLEGIEADMIENYEEGRSYYDGGKKNLMTYVRIGANEKNKLNSEIWPVLPRYIKIEIAKMHEKTVARELAKIAREVALTDYNAIWSDKAIELEKDMKKLDYTNPEQTAEYNRISNHLSQLLVANLKTYMKKNVIKKKAEIEALDARMEKIRKQEPYIAVRRNLVHHVFGNREFEILKLGKNRYTNMIIKLIKKFDMFWKHLVKIIKSNIVLRDLTVLAYNMLSNFLLAILNGSNPFEEIKMQMEALKQLDQYRRDEKMIEELSIKINSGLGTKKDLNDIKRYKASLMRNPVKPLIDAGLYTSAVEDLSQVDLHKETYFDYQQNKFMDKVPGKVKSALDVLYITKNTEFFTGLLLAMQYSDFAARYASYYRLTKKGMDQKKAIKQVLDNQINYGFNHGKIIQWLNARGFILFTKFFEGIQRVLARTTLEKPFNVLLAVMTGGMFLDDSPLGDSLFTRNLTHMVNSPFDLVDNLLQYPAAIEIMTGEFNKQMIDLT